MRIPRVGATMATTPQQFCLRWNNHQSNIVSVFEQLLHSEVFVDVTLAVEGMSLKAHKVVLSACSPYFQAVLASHPDKHPIVILKDVRYVDMRDLLDFMYRGEVSVDQDNLSGFLRVAESLRIKGLTEVNEKKRLESSTLLLSGGIGGSGGVVSSISSPPPSLKRPPLSPTGGSFNKRRRGRPPKISGEESEGDGPGAITDGEDSRTDSEAKDIKIEASDHKEDVAEDARDAESRTNSESAGPSGELHGKEELKLPKEEPDHTRESPGSDLCCIPDIWTKDGGRVVVRGSANCIVPPTTTASSNFSTSSMSPASSNPSTPLPTPNVKQERPTPTNTPNSTVTISPLSPGTPNSAHHAMPPIFAPIQHAPLDLHVTDSCDGNYSDSDQSNVTLDYVLNGNGTATCKLCGELLPSRNHWYRHKYKTHASSLYRCDQCGVVYKSRKGYETHMEVKHAKVKVTTERPRRREWEGVNRVMEEAKRQQEEAMVKAIIARVKLECAMEGEDCSRRGYQKH